MLIMNDRISKPRAGRFFAHSAPEVVALIRQARFRVRAWGKVSRIHLLLLNEPSEFDHGLALASFLPQKYLAVFSMPDVVHPSGARLALDTAIAEFSVIDAQPERGLADYRRTGDYGLMIWRAYVRPPITLTLTRNLITTRSRAEFHYGTAANPRLLRGKETVIANISLDHLPARNAAKIDVPTVR
jgi:hypothetical protein